MRFTFLLIFTFIFSSFLNAQINPKTKWGNVSQAEIDYKEVPFEKDAGAVVLFEEGYMNMRFPIQTTIYRRIKILNQKGIEEANRKLRYQHKHKLQNITGLKAQTINIENGKPVKSEITKNNFYTNEINDVFTSIDFAFPNVKVGSIIEYEYTLNSENMRWINAWYFQDKIPTLYSSITINPQGLYAGFATIAVGELFVKKYKKGRDGNNQHNWSLNNIPSYTKTSFSYNQLDQREGLILQLKKYYKWKDNYYEGTPELVEITTKWTELTKEVYERQKSYNNPTFTKTLLENINKSNDEAQYLKNILQFFKSNYTWNGYSYTMPIPEMSNRQLHKEKRGNLADLNLHFYSLVKSAGYKVDLVLLSTRDNGKLITSYPYIGQFNSVINLVTLKDGKSFLIDASDLSYDLGYMPLRNYNHYGLIVDPSKESFITLNPTLSEFHSTQNYSFNEGKFTLSRVDKSNGYFNNQDTDIPNSFNLNFTEKSKSAPTLLEDKYMGTKAVYQSDAEAQSFYTIQNPLSRILSQYRFDEPSRERSLEFNFPFYYKVFTTIKIPNGYTVEIPQNFKANYESKEKDLIYVQNAEIKDGSLLYSVELLMNKSTFTHQYEDVKKFFEKTNLDASKTILLKKI